MSDDESEISWTNVSETDQYLFAMLSNPAVIDLTRLPRVTTQRTKYDESRIEEVMPRIQEEQEMAATHTTNPESIRPLSFDSPYDRRYDDEEDERTKRSSHTSSNVHHMPREHEHEHDHGDKRDREHVRQTQSASFTHKYPSNPNDLEPCMIEEVDDESYNKHTRSPREPIRANAEEGNRGWNETCADHLRSRHDAENGEECAAHTATSSNGAHNKLAFDKVEDDEMSKRAILLDLQQLAAQPGVKLTKEWTMDDRMEDMLLELQRHTLLLHEREGIATLRDGLQIAVVGIENLNKRMGLLDLEGWSGSVLRNVHKHDYNLSRIYRKWWKRGHSTSPEMDLAIAIFGSMTMHHLQRSMTREMMTRKARFSSRGRGKGGATAAYDNSSSDDEAPPPPPHVQRPPGKQ